jgi:NitT/TauT family transport system permease protein
MTRWRTYTDRLIVLVLILTAWQVGSVLVGPYWLSSPFAVAAGFTAQILNGELIVQGAYTVEEALIGTVIGGVPAVLLPFLLRRHAVIVAILDPFMVGGYGAPKLAFAPLFILWFGIGIESKVALVASVVFFIVYFNTLSGVRALDPRLVQMAQIAGAGERHVAGHIVFPAAVPHILAGFRIAVPYAIGGAIIAELISSNRGLGYLVQTGAMNFDTTSVFAAILAATLIVHAANWLLNAAERSLTQDDNLLPWRTTIDNVLFPLEVQGRLNDENRAQAEVLVRAVGLAGFERYYPHELSGGMRKRAALIRTLAYDPPVILMDEPFAAVHAQTRTQLQADLLTLWGLGRKTIIFVTHDITEAIALGDRALVLSRQPTRIAAEHAIPIPRPRNVQDIFALEGFAAVYQRIRADIQ